MIKMRIEAVGGAVQLDSLTTQIGNQVINNGLGTFNVQLIHAGSKKIAVIKEIRELTGLGLAEAKALVDTPPSLIKSQVSANEAEIIKMRIEAAGGAVQLI